MARNVEAGKTETGEIRVAQSLLDGRMSGHAPEPGRRAGSNRRVELWQATLSQFFKAVGAVGCGTPSGYESISHSAYPPSANQMVARARTRSPRLGTLGLRAADLAAAALGGRPRPRLAGCSIA